jgi:hypothetical protein
MREPPSNWEKASVISSWLLVLTGLGALWFADYQIRESREEAKVQHLVEELNEFDHPPYSDDRKTLALQRMDARQEALKALNVDDPPDAMYNVLNFFEHVSLLANRGYLDKEMAWSDFSYWMFNIYADSRPLIDAERKYDPAEFSELTKLMEDMRQIEIKEGHGVDDHPSQDDILGFYQSEASFKPGQIVSQRHGPKKKAAPKP